ncbi:WbqC family protein [Flavivirga sp. 57AJ16]|uniref:WbqC family protein n=1 Tax=Flavivirga sp. 57AJ16 TaxID=3025307 RepID=UPI0023666391|nr:WbqC family protein [Flavivirga sp. 57AJ16]MDD7885177.1 WbqC family protein [Flavivirga sp. 57AJ16]
MTVSILQSNYIPWKGYFDIIAMSDIFVIYDDVQYTRRDWRNRNLIKTSAGVKWLTIPVIQDDYHQKICDTKILGGNWKKKHMGTLQMNYAKTPCFKDFREAIFQVYDTPTDNLSEINKKFIEVICEILDINTEIVDSRTLNLKGDRQERLIQACKSLNADTYLSGPSAKSYIQPDFFIENSLNLEWMDYSNYKEYNQLYPPFEHGVSVLDLIFNEGTHAKHYLKSFN